MRRSTRCFVALCWLPLSVGVVPFSLGHTDPGEGEIMAAFVPQLTGDPQQDFVKIVDPNETFTVFIIAGPLADSLAGYSFGLEISEAALAAMIEFRSLGTSSAYQNSIGTLVGAQVTVAPECVDLSAPTVVAEIDFVLHVRETTFSMRLSGSGVVQAAPPEYATCSGASVVFDHSAAQVLTLTARDPTATSSVSWGILKALFAHP